MKAILLTIDRVAGWLLLIGAASARLWFLYCLSFPELKSDLGLVRQRCWLLVPTSDPVVIV